MLNNIVSLKPSQVSQAMGQAWDTLTIWHHKRKASMSYCPILNKKYIYVNMEPDGVINDFKIFIGSFPGNMGQWDKRLVA